MAQRNLKRVLAGGALLAALTLASPMPAQAAGLSAESLWSWLSGLWGGTPTAVVGLIHASKPSSRTGSLEKAGPAIDPNGCTGSQTSGSACSSGSSLEPAIDPHK